MYHQIVYSASNGPTGTLVDTAQAADPSFPPRNNHLYVVEPYEVLSAGVAGASVTAAQLSCPTWDSININQLYPVNLSLTVPGNPQLIDYRNQPLAIPQIEEVKAQLSGSNAAAEQESVILTIRPRGGAGLGSLPTSSPLGPLAKVRGIFTATTALTVGTWTADVTLTNTNALRGGTYIVLGGQWVVGSGLAWRLNFVRANLVNGRKLYPGGLCQHAYGDVPLAWGSGPYGPLGQFDTVNLPQISFFAQATVASATYTGYLDLLYMGGSLLQSSPSLAQAV